MPNALDNGGLYSQFSDFSNQYIYTEQYGSICNSYKNHCIGCQYDCGKQFDEYFNGKRKCFKLSLNLNGTDFQKKVWTAVAEIPYGETSTYVKISERIGNRKAARSVGNALSHNPACIVMPCHRVIKSNGDISGYNGGVWRKKWLLAHEEKNKDI